MEKPTRPVGESREPWGMMKKEYREASIEFYNNNGNELWLQSKYHAKISQETHEENIRLKISSCYQYHRQIIKNALAIGKPVSQRVLNEYRFRSDGSIEKQQYEMTFREFKKYLVRTEGFQAIPANSQELKMQRVIHRDYIKHAISEGKTIPQKVWDEYFVNLQRSKIKWK